MTKKNYYDYPFQKEFTAKIVNQTQTDKGYEVILDQTLFYPGGGGQQEDSGSLNRQKLQSIFKNADGEIVHVVAKKLEQTVTGTLDWDQRQCNMQQHSGQHILSAILFNDYGLQTLSAKFDHQEGFIIIPRQLKQDEIQQVIKKINDIIFANKDIETKYISLNDMEKYHLVKLPKDKFAKEGKIRIWHIENFYTIPCGGTHCATTAQVGLLTIVKQTKDGKNAKLFFAAGMVAFDYFQIIQQEQRSIAQLLDAHPTDILPILKKRLQTASDLENQLKSQTHQLILAKIQTALTHVTHVNDMSVYTLNYTPEEAGYIKQVLFHLSRNAKTIVIAKGPNLAISCSKYISPNIIGLLKELLLEYRGKGGGNLAYWQAMVSNQEDFIQTFLRQLLNLK